MSRRAKLIERMRNAPGEVRFAQVNALLHYGGFGPMTASYHNYRGYVFTLTYRAQEPAYTVDFPDFPEIITSAGTLTDAFRCACEALDVHLESMHKLKLKIAKPRHHLVLESS